MILKFFRLLKDSYYNPYECLKTLIDSCKELLFIKKNLFSSSDP